jgi:ABC-type polysaccharide/polyol phosphate export permease
VGQAEQSRRVEQAADLHDAQSAKGWLENRPTTGWLPRLDLRELWSRRELALLLAIRNFKLRYTQASLGVAWVLVQPVAAAAIFAVVFGHAIDVPTEGLPYFLFVYAGLVIWTYVSTAVNSAAESLIEDPSLVTKVYFPRVLAPAAAVLPGLIDVGVMLVLLAVLIVAYGVIPTAALLTLPIWIVGAALLALACGLWLAALNARYRDVRYALGFLMQLWFFATPLVYSSSVFTGDIRYVAALNPLAAVVDGFRWSAIGAHAPGWENMISLGVLIVLLAGGIAYFQRAERHLADVV